MNDEYIKALQDAIRQTHGCRSFYIRTVHVKEVFQGGAAWEGDVEEFGVDHPATVFCYAWGLQDDRGRWQCVALLMLPPVDSPEQAVRAHVLAQAKR
jgi:hypothetical protein